MARQGLAALTGGAMEGYEFVTDRKRDKHIRELLGRENIRLENQERAVGGLDPSGEFNFANFTPPETFGQKALGWVKNLIRPEQQPPMQALQVPADPGYAARTAEPEYEMYEHGGSVRQMRKKYKHGGKAIDKDEDEPGFISRVAESAFPETRRRMKEWAPAGRAADKAVRDAPTAAHRGRAIRENIVEGAKGVGTLASGLMEDSGALALGRAVEGFLGYGTGGEDEGRALPVATPPGQAPEQLPAAQPTAQPAAQPAAGGQPSQAVPSGAQESEREIDFSTEAREVMPEDIPSHSSKDWEKERRYWAAYALTQGKDPFAAMDAVDAQQLNGFSRYAMQATALLDGGDLEGASRALYAAYQYFPNGKDVKFGVQKGKDGQRVVVAMGQDEESGESSGPPQVLDRNVISRMVENMSKPGTLRAWTTDWQATEQKLWEQGFKRDELKEKGRHNRAMEGAYSARTAAVGAGGGMKQSDLDRAFGEFIKDQELEKLGDPQTARYLARVMTELYQQIGGGREGEGYSTIIDAVMAAHEDGSLETLREQYGLQ